MSKKFYVYRHYDKYKNLLYVGCTDDLKNRYGQHKQSAHWFHDIEDIKYEVFDLKIEAFDRERELINSRKPSCNIQHNPEFEVLETFSSKRYAKVELVHNMEEEIDRLYPKSGFRSREVFLTWLLNRAIKGLI